MSRIRTASGIVLALALAGCGGGGSSSPTPIPSATPTPAPGPTPTPTPTPPPSNLASGPVYAMGIKVRTVDTGGFNYRPFFENPDGSITVYRGEFVVFDSTPRNRAGEECQWIGTPIWYIEDVDVQEGALDPKGVFRRRGSSQPFLLRTDVVGTGRVRVQVFLDGVYSRFLEIVAQ